jgi:hypothetical protein
MPTFDAGAEMFALAARTQQQKDVMAVYNVYEPPRRAAAPLAPERFAFVRDGFSLWAFLFAPLWMLWHRMWLVLVGYVVLVAALDVPARVLGASPAALAIISILIAFLVGIEASTLRRFTLSRRGWTAIGVVTGRRREEAERRFFDAWVRKASSAAVPPAAPPAPVPRVAQTPMPDIIGLFPEPGAQR